MSLTTGVAGLPFEWGPDGRHQYGECFLSKFVSAVTDEYSVVEVAVPSGRVAYFSVLETATGTATDLFYFQVGRSSLSMTGGGTAVAINDESQLGSFDCTSSYTMGTVTAQLTASNDQVIQRKSDTPDFPVEFPVPIVVPSGRYFQVQCSVASRAIQRITLRWHEKVVPT